MTAGNIVYLTRNSELIKICGSFQSGIEKVFELEIISRFSSDNTKRYLTHQVLQAAVESRRLITN